MGRSVKQPCWNCSLLSSREKGKSQCQNCQSKEKTDQSESDKENINHASFDEDAEKVSDEEEEEEEKKGLQVKTEIDPEYLRSLPAGWSYRNVQVGLGNIIKRFISPAGKEFTSRIEAVRSLSETAGAEVEAAQLRSGLSVDGWMSHPLLPSGWLAKPVCSTGTVFKFLTGQNQLLVGKKKVLKHLEGNEDYDNLTSENVEKFLSLYLNMRRVTSHGDEWLKDESLPQGWRYKKQGGTGADLARILSPSGEIFPSRQKALLHMIQNKFSEPEVRKMRSSLMFDGWLESELLPQDWSYRKCKTGRNEYNFLSPQGEIFRSQRSLVDYYRSHYTEQDVRNIDVLFEEIKSKWVNTKHAWKVDDPSVPPGWKIRYFVMTKAGKEHRRFSLMTPGGLVFQSRVKAVQHFVQNKSGEGQEGQVGPLLDCLSHEGWETNSSLPENWRVKGSLFFTSEGLVLSLKSAVSHMESLTDKYSRDDLDNILRLAKNSRAEAERRKIVWQRDPGVPEGWQFRSRHHNNNTREYFLTPAGLELVGRTSAIQWLLQQGKSPAHPEVQTLIAGLPSAGWEAASDLLPSGWWRKEKTAKPGSFKFLSPDCKEFSSLSFVYHHLRANGCPGRILNNIKKKLNIRNLLSNRKVDKKERISYRWREEPGLLPPGWKLAEKELRYGSRKVFYLSDSGILLKSAALAYQLMKAENVELKYLSFIEDKLAEEGWTGRKGRKNVFRIFNDFIVLDDHYLPADWKLNLDKEKFPENFLNLEEECEVLFLTGDGNILTRNEASGLISDKSSSKFSAEDLSNYLFLLSTLASRIEHKGWVEDSHIPQGWRLKDVNLGERRVTQVLSQEGQLFDSLLSAFLHVNSRPHSFTVDDINNLKDKLEEEGFTKDQKLPEGWLIARGQREQVFELLSRGNNYQVMLITQLCYLGLIFRGDPLPHSQ